MSPSLTTTWHNLRPLWNSAPIICKRGTIVLSVRLPAKHTCILNIRSLIKTLLAKVRRTRGNQERAVKHPRAGNGRGASAAPGPWGVTRMESKYRFACRLSGGTLPLSFHRPDVIPLPGCWCLPPEAPGA